MAALVKNGAVLMLPHNILTKAGREPTFTVCFISGPFVVETLSDLAFIYNVLCKYIVNFTHF
ncbi:hypothetical protein D3C75_1205400 [compost metagenome]